MAASACWRRRFGLCRISRAGDGFARLPFAACRWAAAALSAVDQFFVLRRQALPSSPTSWIGSVPLASPCNCARLSPSPASAAARSAAVASGLPVRASGPTGRWRRATRRWRPVPARLHQRGPGWRAPGHAAAWRHASCSSAPGDLDAQALGAFLQGARLGQLRRSGPARSDRPAGRPGSAAAAGPRPGRRRHGGPGRPASCRGGRHGSGASPPSACAISSRAAPAALPRRTARHRLPGRASAKPWRHCVVQRSRSSSAARASSASASKSSWASLRCLSSALRWPDTVGSGVCSWPRLPASGGLARPHRPNWPQRPSRPRRRQVRCRSWRPAPPTGPARAPARPRRRPPPVASVAPRSARRRLLRLRPGHGCAPPARPALPRTAGRSIRSRRPAWTSALSGGPSAVAVGLPRRVPAAGPGAPVPPAPAGPAARWLPAPCHAAGRPVRRRCPAAVQSRPIAAATLSGPPSRTARSGRVAAGQRPVRPGSRCRGWRGTAGRPARPVRPAAPAG